MANINQRYIFAIGQCSFQTNSNHFATVVPISNVDGEIVNRESMFPEQGLCWWMLQGELRLTQAPPGCLIIAGIKEAQSTASSSSREHHFQLLQPSLPTRKDLIEILSPPNTSVTDPNELLEDFQMQCDHEPTQLVLVRLGDYLYGPLKVELDNPVDRTFQPHVSFTTPNQPPKTYKINASLMYGRLGYIDHTVNIAHGTWPPNDNDPRTKSVRYEAITGTLFKNLMEIAEDVELVTIRNAARQVARNFLSRRATRDFINKLNQYIDGGQSSDAAIARVQQFISTHEKNLSALDDIFEVLVTDNHFKSKIDEALESVVDKKVEVKAAHIDARANERIAEINDKIDEQRKKYEEDRAVFSRKHAQDKIESEEEISAMWKDFATRQEEKKKELHQQEKSIRESLEAVSDKLAKNRMDIINQFLSLEPLLQQLDLGNSKNSVNSRKPLHTNNNPLPNLNLQNFLEPNPERTPVSEEEFFNRFVSHVEYCGFKYDRLDLLAFHFAAKDQSPIILGGASGSGKSSLPVLYAEALAGNSTDNHSGNSTDNHYLAVDVNPSWSSPTDLFGYTDAFNHKFIPATSGMFHHLINAYRLHDTLGLFAPIFTVCLEELNLAQPEHYLADIIQAISRSSGRQYIKVFDPRAVQDDDSFKMYAHLEITPNLIIVGTVNFDETTKQLSKRLLDRCSLIKFKVSDHLPVHEQMLAQTGSHKVEGQPVLQFERNQWTKKSNIQSRVVELLGDILPILNDLGCGLTHRRQMLIYRFIANAPESLCGLNEALDMQLQQRILPQIRELYKPGALDALNRLIEILEKYEVPRTCQVLIDLLATEKYADYTILGEE